MERLELDGLTCTIDGARDFKPRLSDRDLFYWGEV